MPKKRHTPEEIIGKLREVEVRMSQGVSAAEAIRGIGVSEQTFYRWRKEYGGLKLDQAKRLKELEKENAQLPWNGATGAFFGNVDRVDEDRRFYGADEPGMGKVMQEGEELPPPDLIIQDELHLISGPLGTVAGLYETAVDALATRTVNGRPVRPKIVASTATVRRAHDQIGALFDREATAIFPAPGINLKDSWFAITRPAEEEHARRYVGIAALGQGPRVVFMRTLINLLAGAQDAFERIDHETPLKPDGWLNPADPYTTAVCYFNALRELGGARRIVEDEVRERVRRYGSERVRAEPDDRPFADRAIGGPVELTSRVSTDDVARAKQRLETLYGEDGHADVALATNMISVGLDITRLGLMLVHGQPKSAAEYIQSTSRVGRDSDRPGLVVAILNVHKPRDKAHYEDFAGYHAAFYRAVEATSVTPWSARALDRALAASMVAVIRHTEEALTPENRAGKLFEDPSIGERARALLMRRAEKQLKNDGLDALRARIDRLLAIWAELGDEQTEAGGSLKYGGGGQTALLHQPLDPDIDPVSGSLDERYRHFQAAWSMRDVEAPVALEIRTPRDQPLNGQKGGL